MDRPIHSTSARNERPSGWTSARAIRCQTCSRKRGDNGSWTVHAASVLVNAASDSLAFSAFIFNYYTLNTLNMAITLRHGLRRVRGKVGHAALAYTRPPLKSRCNSWRFSVRPSEGRMTSVKCNKYACNKSRSHPSIEADREYSLNSGEASNASRRLFT